MLLNCGVKRRLLRVPWTARRSNQSILKEISPEYSLEELMLKLKRQYFGHQRLTHLKRPSCWERLKVEGEGDDRGWDGCIASLTQWTWVWVNSGNWWWTGRPGVLQSMGLQIVGHDFVTELNWAEGLPWASQMALKNPPANTGRYHGGGHGHPLQYFCLENPKDRVAWWATVHGFQTVGHHWATNTFTFT